MTEVLVMQKGKKRSLKPNDNYIRADNFERSGKWTIEEEAFAERIIVEFESGSLIDCNEGITLRSYLSRRLKCAPMRISKKFAGKCIGKVRLCLNKSNLIKLVLCLIC